jgi:lysophospholipase L1-like esterase
VRLGLGLEARKRTGGPPTFLPALATGGASYHAVYSNERLVEAYVGPLARAATGSTDMGTGQTGITAANVTALAGAATALRMDRWYDQTGNARTAAQTTAASRPELNDAGLINGKPAMLFDGARSFEGAGSPNSVRLDFTHNLTGRAATWFLVIDPTVTVQSQNYQGYTSGASNIRDTFSWADEGFPYGPQNSGNLSYQTSNGIPGFRKIATSPQVLVIRESGTGSDMFFDGTKITSATIATNVGLTTGSIGTSSLATMQQWYPRFRCLAAIAVSGTLTDGDVASVYAALVSRFTINTSYQARTILIGDSNAEPYASTDTFGPDWYFRSLITKRVQCFNLGIAGKTLSACYADRAAYEGAIFAYNTALPTAFIIEGGGNDLNGGGSAASLYTTLTDYVTYIHSLGANAKAIACTISPQSLTGSHASIATVRDAYNVLVRANSAGADAIADYAADPTVGVYPTSCDNPLYYPDKIHMSSLAYSIIAPITAAAVNAVV